MDDHKSEVENWDLGAGIYVSFYLLKSSLEEECDTMSEPVCVQLFNFSCQVRTPQYLIIALHLTSTDTDQTVEHGIIHKLILNKMVSHQVKLRSYDDHVQKSVNQNVKEHCIAFVSTGFP